MTWSERQAQAKKRAEEEEERSLSATFKPPPVGSTSSFGGVSKSAALGGAGVAAAVGTLRVAAADADEEQFVGFLLIVNIACLLT